MDISELIEKNCEIPPLPTVATEVMRLVDDPMTSIDTLQAVIMTDQVFAANLLKMANSAFYRTGRDIETVSDAIITLGIGALKRLTLAASTRNLFKRFGLLEKKLWEHSIGVSYAAHIIAKSIHYISPEEASVIGLIHDIGKVIMNNGDPDKYILVTESVYNDGKTYYMAEEFFFGFNHAEVGGLAARKWKFPLNMCEVIRRHHYFRSFSDLSDLSEDTAMLCCITVLADATCARLGIGYRGPMNELSLMDRECLRMLDINEKDFTKITEEIKKRFDEEASR